MRSLLRPSVLIFVSSLIIAVAGMQTPPASAFSGAGNGKSMETREQNVAEIKALEERFETAFRARDVNAIMQLCVPDESLVVFDVHTPREIKGSDAYRKDWEDLFSSFAGPLEADVSEMDVAAGGDVAFVRYIHHVVGIRKDGRKSDSTVRVTDCLKKINGKWLIAHSHVSAPIDLRTGQGDMQSKP